MEVIGNYHKLTHSDHLDSGIFESERGRRMDRGGFSDNVFTEQVTTKVTSLPPRAGYSSSSSSRRTGHSMGYGADIIGSSNSYLIATGRGSNGGYSKTRFPSSSYSISPDTTLERKTTVGRNAGYEGSSSGNSSPELSRKEFSSSNTRGRSQGRESAIRARLQSASPNGRWTELEDVKRLLKGSRSASTSPPRSAPSTLPYPKKAVVETKMVTANSQSVSGRYDTALVDSALPTYNWTSTVPPGSSSVGLREYRNNLATTGMQMYNTTGSTSVTAHNVHKNKAASPSAASVGMTTVTVQGLPNNLVANSNPLAGMAQTVGTHTQVLGVQKNQVSNSTVGTSGNSSTAMALGTDGMLDKDYRFVLLDKEKAPSTREAQLLIMAKDSGKLFTTVSSGFSGSEVDESLKKEQLLATRSGADITAQSRGKNCWGGLRPAGTPALSGEQREQRRRLQFEHSPL
ncbi:collagen alpha-1(XVII) chain-like [Leucoraja erinacea]|uniref:collagen alpha-1(XVII) chain-like n=1 Tax=Leucoraja erinaceus TaxID=7782 RepID=UPI00245613AC|nr:collagen alpha-1(XVII) chain-like [Leucoraja erinacea]